MAGLQGKVVIVTGASSGIGAETAVEFARRGCRVAVTARRREQLEATAAKCREAGLSPDQVLVIPADLAKDDDLTRIVDTTAQTFGAIDILVNNAGINKVSTFQAQTVDDLDLIYRINTRAVFILCQLVIPHVIKSKGSIVNITSGAGIRAAQYAPAYSIAKAGANMLTTCLALELAPKGVRVNAVCPGTIETEIFEKASFLSQGETKPQLMARMGKAHPMGRVGVPGEVAKTVVFLASSDATFITGAALPVDGGRTTTVWNPPPKPTAPTEP